MTMRHPTIHLNGTGSADLLAGYESAMDALQRALSALSQCGPNARDYYVQSPEAYTEARDQHYARAARLQSVLDETTALAVAVMEQQELRDLRRAGCDPAAQLAAQNSPRYAELSAKYHA